MLVSPSRFCAKSFSSSSRMAWIAPPLLQALCSAAVSAAGAAAWTRLLSLLRRKRVLTRPQTRKLMHITTAPFFLLTTPLYPSHPISRILAAAVPLSYTLSILRHPRDHQLVSAVALSDSKQQDAVATASYAFSTAVITAIGWRSSAATYVAMCALCFGDAFAAIIGSSIQSPIIPYANNNKSVAGTVSCFAATLFSSAVVLTPSPMPTLSPVALILSAAVASIMETMPVQDNLTVPLSAFITASLFEKLST